MLEVRLVMDNNNVDVVPLTEDQQSAITLIDEILFHLSEIKFSFISGEESNLKSHRIITSTLSGELQPLLKKIESNKISTILKDARMKANPRLNLR